MKIAVNKYIKNKGCSFVLCENVSENALNKSFPSDIMMSFFLLQTTVVTFAIYVSLQPDHTLKPSVAFVAISLFGLLKEPLSEIPRSISFLIMVTD